jgi:SAM-dependent methyltransferase
MEVKDHYDLHLAKFYSWMFGDFESKVNENAIFFQKYNIHPRINKICIDLGAGSGFQAIALARMGFDVMAVDFCRPLLQELERNKGKLNIKILEADILDSKVYADKLVELIVCMGDTLTHLPGKSAVAKLIHQSFSSLSIGGQLVITYRDLSYELEGNNRFIPVKSDTERVFTCFLEYFGDYVKVHDLVHEKKDGSWTQNASSYKKLRISKSELERMFEDAGFEIVVSSVENGMTVLIGRKV